MDYNVQCIALDAFEGCYRLKKLVIGGNCLGGLKDCTNLETLVLTKLPTDSICQYFESPANVPLTLQNIILTEDIVMQGVPFYALTGIKIYVESEENDVRWNENYHNWH